MRSDTLAVHTTVTPTFRERVDEALREFLDSKTDFWLESGNRPVLGALRTYVLSPGKRLRPTFCFWGWRGAGGADCPEIIRVAASLELFHSFCLIHDDIMNISDTRRGQPSLHRQLADVHARSDWRGEASRYGANTALVVGDLLVMWADELLHTSGLTWQDLRIGYPWVARMREEVCLGQFLDADEQAHGGSLDGALRVIAYKTASYTIERPLQIGAAFAGASAELLGHLGDIGRPLGEAFQLRDDLLGAFGDPKVTGKSNLDDFRDGKPTALLAVARARASGRQNRQICALNGNARITAAGAATLRQIIVDTGARQVVETMIDDRVAQARVALARTPLAQATVRGEFDDLITSAAHRDN